MRSVHKKKRLCFSLGYPKVGRCALLPSSAAQTLTHLTPYCGTDTDPVLGNRSHSPQVLGRPLYPGQLHSLCCSLFVPQRVFLFNSIPCVPCSWSRRRLARETRWTAAWRSWAEKRGVERAGGTLVGGLRVGARLFWNRLSQCRETLRAPGAVGKFRWWLY